MSDKSFGDCTNRNVVKNPLLSTAVTGLSIEDLTHNAVLLPAVPSQELITIQDQKNEAQNITLRHLDHDITNFPSGDAASYQTQSKSSPHLIKTLPDNQKQTQNITNNENLITTKSKASYKTDDDFDVNEYFARLQGTRYVSAPLNSHLKEDQNANLQAEENLEEINLNEPEKKQTQDDFQHSLTADIAQNFSQLPSVLPQVASAVFSSFSNMLNLKSREQTPDDVKMYQHAQKPEITVPLAVPEPPPQAMPPQLKEPPVSGNTSNYRITTKKKVYAQIPGLSSGDNQIHTYNTPPVGQTPYYFTPEATVPENKQESFHITLDQSQSHQDKDRIEAKSTQGAEGPFDVINKSTDEFSRDVLTQPNVIAENVQKETNPIKEFDQDTFKRNEDTKVHENVFISQTQVETMRSNNSYSNENRDATNVQQSLFSSVTNNEIPFSIGKSQVDLNYSSNQFVPISQVSTSIIPPPPMFSSIPRKDNQPTSKSILPPSVARRIGSNQPVIKSLTTNNTILPDNIFIPNILPELQCASGEMHTNLQQHVQQDPVYNIPIGQNRNVTDTKISPKDYLGSSSLKTPGFNPYIQTSVTATSQNIVNESIIVPSKTTDISSVVRPQKDLSKAEKEKENRLPISNIYHLDDSNKYPPNIIDNNIIPEVMTETSIAPPMFFNPTSAAQPNISSSIIEDQKYLATQNKMPPFYSNEYAPEPPKAITEPPKVSSSLNYRMIKKRPQYYSGPIEGLGSISNNIKPTINPLEPNVYHGALFNPDQMQSEHNLPVNYDAPSQQEPLTPFDISRPANVPTQSANDSYSTQKQMAQTDFSTAFDLSRPTTERYEETQNPESKRFGIIGSLKSKLSSIDINKIQNTVTTFFDPAYNEPSKAEPAKETESSLQKFTGNYQNFPHHESATLEVFVPNKEHGYHPANLYNYPMQTYQNQQYYPTQEYFNKTHNYSKDYYNDNLNLSAAGTDIPNIVGESHSENYSSIKTQSTNVEPNFDMITSCNQADTACIVGAKRKSIDNVTQITDQSKSVFDEFTLTQATDGNIISHLNPIVDSNNKKKIEETEITGSLLKNYYGSSTDIQTPRIKEVITEDFNEQDTPNNDIIHQLQSVADSTLKNVFDCKSPIVVESVLAKDIEEPFSTISTASLVDPAFIPFFDYQQPIFAIPENNNIKQTINNHPLNVDLTHSFFDYQAPIINPLPGNKEDYIISNSAKQQNAIIENTLEMLSESTEFNNLCPLLQSKSENLQGNASVFSGKSNLNETALFSLFEQPSLLPPLQSLDLSKISSISLPVPIKESTEIKNLENKMDNVSLFGNIENITKFERKSSFFDKTLPVEDDNFFVDNQVSDLSICETCREVNKQEDKEPDLTTQLIGNITAPIQLAHPVEFPVIGSTSVPDISEFSNQFAEISYIPEDIIETMKQPPSVEPREDSFIPAIPIRWSDPDLEPTLSVRSHNYNFQAGPNIIGFFDDKSLFFESVPTNASDELKAEYKISQDDTIVLPRQLSIPTAPPEEDSNSDESGLDVHSIEQDAKKDFPIYEDFGVDPSETDDDKIEFKERERYPEDSHRNDTFTNRVERFKQMETSTDPPEVYEIQKAPTGLRLGIPTSPALTIASYFDTGNYAVETHYKNSLTSPPSIPFGANVSSATSIPPGFEEEYKRKHSGISSKHIPIGLNVGNITYIPDTTTQTPVTVCLTFTQPSNMTLTNVHTTDTSAVTKSFVQEAILTNAERLPAFSSIIEPNSETFEHKDNEHLLVEETETEIKPSDDTLPDSSNFFSSNEESTANPDVYNNFSRLSSYFTTPPKPDHSKSFFELSQSQNHYRHKPDQLDSIQSKVKKFFDSEDSTKKESSDIPQNYLANMNLLHDLASHKNITPKEDVVKIVNYFTISYDVDLPNIGEPKSSLDLTEKSIDKNADGLNELGDVDETNICVDDVLKQCKYCYDPIKTFYILSADSAYKVKNCMDNSDSKSGENNMSSKQENVKKSVTINLCDSTFDETDEKIVVSPESRNSSDYAPVKHHWFYRVDYEGKSIWRGFSVADSKALENAFNSPDLNETTVVATDGGRFDVNVVGRLRIPVYWTDKPTNVMRCSWFYKGNIDARYVPYAESDAEKLEIEYRHGVTTSEWHRRLMLPNNEMVVMHGPAVMVHFLQASPTDGFGSNPLFTFGKRVYRNPPKINVAGDQPIKIDHLIFLVHGAGEYRHQKEKISTMRPRVVRRGCVESEIEDTEPSSIDHLLLLCHGVGSACDMRFRSVEEVVDDFRTTSLQLIQSHYKNSYDSGVIGRVEVLPISWHSSLHSGETGVDRRLAAVTLESIPRLRNFTNDTILDVLFYTSPVYCQTIVETVCKELNRIYKLFKTRNPGFNGGVSLGGHSLGSVILYDLLCHQKTESLKVSSTTKHYVSGTAGTGQPTVMYPGLVFKPDALYALGSPIAIFECIRGVETLGQDFCLPTCKNFFNIFHPYDPIAYRLEPMINPLLRDVKPSLIPHHKGRKRMHLELKDTMARVGADIKQKLIESIRSTWSSMWRTSPPPPEQHLEKVVEEIEKEELTADTKEEHNQYEVTPDTLGRLNNGRRIDHVLQEAPFEIFNEYLFAMTSHVCYWESEDTMLVMLREIYNTLGVSPDCSLPQHTMTVERSRVLEDPDNPIASSADYPSTSRGTL